MTLVTDLPQAQTPLNDGDITIVVQNGTLKQVAKAQFVINTTIDAQVAAVAADLVNIDAVAGDLDNVDTVATNLATINSVASDLTNINTVAGNSADISAVAGDLTNIDLVAADLTNVDLVADNVTNIVSAGANTTNINTLVADLTNVDLVAADLTNIDLVAASIADVDAVAGDLTNIDLVAGDLTNIDAVAAALITGTTGTGKVVLQTNPILVTPNLGTPSAGNLTNCTFPTLNQDTSGSAGTVDTISGLITSGTNISFNGAGTSGNPYVVSATLAGTVTSVSVVTANGLSGSVANATTTPAITLDIGDINPSSVNSVVISGSSAPTLSITGTASVSGSNTGDQTSVSGNAGTVTTINGKITAGSNVTIAGSGTSGSPYNISSTGGGGGGTPGGTDGQIQYNNSGAFGGKDLSLSDLSDIYVVYGSTNNVLIGNTNTGAWTHITTAVDNTALGFDTLTELTSGNYNTALGISALSLLATGSSNVAVGINAATIYEDATGTVAIGDNAVGNATTGDLNTAIGYNSGGTLETGSHNVLLGASADVTGTAATNQIALGYAAVSPGDNKAQIGNTSIADVYFGDTTAILHADGSALTGTASSLTAGTVTTNANLTGPITSVGNATAIASSISLPGSPTTTTQSASDRSTKIATTDYADTAAANAASAASAGLQVDAATTAASDTSSWTYSNGVSGVGATFTGPVNTAITIDGYSFSATGKDLLIKNDTQSPSGAFNGNYRLTALQTVGTGAIFTRRTDYDSTSDINDTGAIAITNGTVNGGSSYILTTKVTTVGTDPLTYTIFTPPYANILQNGGALGTPSSGTLTNCSGTASGLTAGTVTTNANLTGVITSSGNATSIASQTGTGTKFVVDNTPTLITPVIGVATATSVNKMAITAPATSSTLAVADGKTFTASNTITLTGTDTVSMNVSNQKIRTIGFSAVTPVTGQQGAYVVFPVAGTITGWSIVADAGTATVKVYKIAAGTTAPTIASNSISTNGVALSTGTMIQSTDVTDFTSTVVTAGDAFLFNLFAVATATKLDFQLQITVT